MKKLLLLGGSAQQVVAIETAKKMGYYTVLCDYLDNNPGQYAADKFYQTSTTDMEAVLKIAKKENIDGIIAYASDPAAPTAAYVSEKLGLATNPYKSVDILCNKDKFRDFLRDSGFNTPVSGGYTAKADAIADKEKFRLPVIVKPVDSSGSKGATVLNSWDELESAVDFAFSFSRGSRIIVEEFIEKKHKYLIGGDVFIVNGEIVLWGLLNCHRDNNVNPLVPVGKSYPLELETQDIQSVKNTLQSMVDKLQLKNGAMNVELIVDKNGLVWPIDVGPRCGGNMIPDLLGYIFDVDVVKMSVQTAMGETLDVKLKHQERYFATHNIHSAKSGVYKDLKISDGLEKHIIKKCIYPSAGDRVEYFDDASKALGIIFMQFNDRCEMNDILENINSNIEIVLE